MPPNVDRDGPPRPSGCFIQTPTSYHPRTRTVRYTPVESCVLPSSNHQSSHPTRNGGRRFILHFYGDVVDETPRGELEQPMWNIGMRAPEEIMEAPDRVVGAYRCSPMRDTRDYGDVTVPPNTPNESIIRMSPHSNLQRIPREYEAIQGNVFTNADYRPTSRNTLHGVSVRVDKPSREGRAAARKNSTRTSLWNKLLRTFRDLFP